MKRTWISTGAAIVYSLTASVNVFAADVRVQPQIPAYGPPPIPFYSWTGLYAGGNLGGAWASGTLTDDFTDTSFTGNNSGFIGGAQIGYNWQVAPQFVLGVEWTFDGTSINNSSNTVAVFGPHGTALLQGSASTDWVSTLAARFGYSVNNWLFYGKAGGGWVGNSITVTDQTNGASFSNSDVNSGWLVGVGLEYGLTPNWTLKAEYDHLALSDFTRSRSDFLFPGDTVTLSREINMFVVGANYKFW